MVISRGHLDVKGPHEVGVASDFPPNFDAPRDDKFDTDQRRLGVRGDWDCCPKLLRAHPRHLPGTAVEKVGLAGMCDGPGFARPAHTAFADQVGSQGFEEHRALLADDQTRGLARPQRGGRQLERGGRGAGGKEAMNAVEEEQTPQKRRYHTRALKDQRPTGEKKERRQSEQAKHGKKTEPRARFFPEIGLLFCWIRHS